MEAKEQRTDKLSFDFKPQTSNLKPLTYFLGYLFDLPSGYLDRDVNTNQT
jgi:hypothetical protein